MNLNSDSSDDSASDDDKQPMPTRPPPADDATLSSMPVLNRWTRTSSGTIEGDIFGRKGFKDGTKMETSEIEYEYLDGLMPYVVSRTGSHYRLGEELAAEDEHRKKKTRLSMPPPAAAASVALAAPPSTPACTQRLGVAPSITTTPTTQQLLVGARVQARFMASTSASWHGSKFYPGTVRVVHPDGSVAVDYDDGDEEEHVHPMHVKWSGNIRHVRLRLRGVSVKVHGVVEPCVRQPKRCHEDLSSSGSDYGLKRTGSIDDLTTRGRGRLAPGAYAEDADDEDDESMSESDDDPRGRGPPAIRVGEDFQAVIPAFMGSRPESSSPPQSPVAYSSEASLALLFKTKQPRPLVSLRDLLGHLGPPKRVLRDDTPSLDEPPGAQASNGADGGEPQRAVDIGPPLEELQAALAVVRRLEQSLQTAEATDASGAESSGQAEARLLQQRVLAGFGSVLSLGPETIALVASPEARSTLIENQRHAIAVVSQMCGHVESLAARTATIGAAAA